MGTTRTILLVEDEELVRRYLSQLLEKNNWKVTTARSGVEALSTLTLARFDVALCDLDLGAGINGVDVLNRLPTESRGTPFVILTAHGTIDRCLEAMRNGATDFLEKPISPAKLFSALDRAIGLTAPSGKPGEPEDSAWRDTIGDQHVRRALRIIDQQFSNPDFSVAALAKAIDITPDHVARLFRAHLRRNPLEQIHEIRISAAEKLLGNPTLSIYEVALECGYANSTELEGWFRHFKLTTPSAWRARGRRGG